MGRVRPYVPADAADTIALHERTLLGGLEQTPEVRAFVRTFYESTLVTHPWADENLPPLVYERKDGKTIGFLGVLPRPMIFRDQRITIALATRFMVCPHEREGSVAATALFTRFLRGRQDLSLTDVANEQSRRIWQASRGVVVPASSLWWSTSPQPMDPTDDVSTAERDLDSGALLDLVHLASRHRALRPAYDDRSMTWLLSHLEQAQHRGSLHRRIVVDDRGESIGWFVYYANSDGHNGVQQMGAIGDAAPQVVDHLLRHARQVGGAPTTTGRLDLPFADALRARGSRLALGPWTLAHSRNEALLLALTSGDAYFTRMEGEF